MTNAEGMPRALDGLRVIEVAEGISAPYCGKLLADLGAEVIKVERLRHGDVLRGRAPFYHDERSPDGSLLFNFLNTSKLGVTLDIDAPAGRALLDRLMEDADVLLAGGTPAEIERRELHFEAYSAKQPNLVCTYVTPFGMTGPYRDWKGGELIAFHMSGLGLATPRDRLSIEGRRPLKGAEHQALSVAGLNAAVATMHGLFAREASGHGQCVDVSELEPLACYQFLQIARWTYAGDNGDRGYGEGSRGFFASDGGIAMLLFTGQMQQWDAFKELLGNPDWLEGYGPPISRIPEDDPFWSHLNEWSTRYTREEIYRKAQGLRVPVFPENTVPEAVESDQVRSRGFIQPMPLANGASTGAPVAPYVMSETPARVSGPAPTLGRDNHLVFCERLGVTEEEFAHASAAGVI